jgi:hypothetical protein
MTVYEHRASITTTAGASASTTLRIPGGLLRQVLVRAATNSTIFRVDLVDATSLTRLNYAYHTGELNDTNIALPVAGDYVINITNASPNDTFSILFAVQER